MDNRQLGAIVGAATTLYWTWDYNATTGSKVIWTILGGLAGGVLGEIAGRR